MKVLITGATGFVGQEIVSELLDGNFKIYQVGNSNVNSHFYQEDFFKVDITNFEDVCRLKRLTEVDAVVHSAGLAHQFGSIKKEKFQKTNVEGTKYILELAVMLKVKHFVLISSTAVYGTEKKTSKVLKVIDESTVCCPQTFYAESKLKAEQIAIEVCKQNNINLTIFRLSPVIGEGNAGNVARMIEAIDKRRFLWIGSGENYKSLIYKKDVGRACREVLTKKKNGIEIFNLAAEPVLMRDFVAIASKKLNKKIPDFYVPQRFIEKLFLINEKTFQLKRISKVSKTIEKWLSDDVYSTEKFEREYSFRPQTLILEALEKQISRYQEQKGNKGVERK